MKPSPATTRAPARPPGHRAGLTRGLVLAAGLDQLAVGGLASVTMRAVAQRLEVAPNTLYSHVRDKTELLDGLLDETLAAVWTPRGTVDDPQAAVRRVMTSTYEVLLDRPDLVPVFLARQGARGPHAVHLGRVVTGLLASAGVRDPQPALEVLIIQAIGFAAFSSDGARAAATRASFERGLEWVLTGVLSG